MNILAFFAHPDDETIMAGGTLALLARQGAQVHYLCATRGEGGEAGDPPICSRQMLPSVRSDEFSCAVRALAGASHHFLGFIDPTVGPERELYPFAEDPVLVAEPLVSEIQRLKVDALITHGSGGEYGHPAHRLAHQAAALAIADLGKNAPLFYTIQAAFDEHPKPHLINHNDPAHLVLDTSPVLENKLQATLCHRTQHALFVRSASLRAGKPVSIPELVTAFESLHRVYPPVNGGVEDGLAVLLRGSGCVIRG